ncbi:MAG TPA: DUF4149 domain-containing protein [Balneolales bacterium]|nr:DUF4149 domain-containing protein [Balneolales bacterium]
MRVLLYHISVFIHIISAMVWVGGILFMVLVIVPLLRKKDLKSSAATLVQKVGVQFRLVGWISLILLLITGIFNLGFRGYHWSDLWSGALWQGSFGHILAVKLLFVSLIYLISAVHDFYIGPKATELWQEDPASPKAKKLRKAASWIGRLNLIFALIVVFEAISLVRGPA